MQLVSMASLSACYEQGGVGNRVQNAAFAILKQSQNFSHLADALLEAAKIYTTAEDNICTATYMISGETYIHQTQFPVNMQYYNSLVSDTELLKLTIFAYEADNAKGNPAEAYARLLQRFPNNNPLSKVTADQITYVHDNLTGFTAFVISDGRAATVVFPGTNGNGLIGDVLADFKLSLGITSAQADEANKLIESISRSHANIVVTGHSLGGYLATSATLHNEGINRCVAFDPPGRWGDLFPAKGFKRSRASKVTTYENTNSKISWVGMGVGDVKNLELDDEPWYGWNHSSKKMLDAMEAKYGAIKSSWVTK